MKLIRIILLCFAVVISFPGRSDDSLPSTVEGDKKPAQAMTEADGIRLIKSGKSKEAIEYFDKVILGFEDKYKSDKTRYFCSRSPTESLFYLAGFKSDGVKLDAKVVPLEWAYAYYFKAYAMVELGNPSEAKTYLNRALALSPRNAQFLSELANIYQREKDLPMALKSFQLAEAAAKEVSPPKFKDLDLIRAWRGIGYTLIEQNRLDEAEKIFRQCLELDKNDATSIGELQYIQRMRAKRPAQ
jgi:tetratricopeptide (TPR) repeat protein